MPKSNLPALIDEGASLKATIKEATARLKEIEAEILPLGAGKYEGATGTACQVICASPAIKPGKDAIEAVKAVVGEEHFKTIFDRVVNFQPCKGFRDVVAALLTPAKATKVFALCEAPSTPYVKWA